METVPFEEHQTSASRSRAVSRVTQDRAQDMTAHYRVQGEKDVMQITVIYALDKAQAVAMRQFYEDNTALPVLLDYDEIQTDTYMGEIISPPSVINLDSQNKSVAIIFEGVRV